MLKDRIWLRPERQSPGTVSDAQASAKDTRLFLEDVFWGVHTGPPWRNFLPLPGFAYNMKGVAPLNRGIPFGALLTSEALDENWLLNRSLKRGTTAVFGRNKQKEPSRL